MRGYVDGQVAGYRDLVESLAPKFVGRNGAELDDLVQEGLIFVWQSLERKHTPAPSLIEGRMHDWVRLLGTQVGRGRGATGEAVEYATLLPLDGFAGTDEAGETLTLMDTLSRSNTIDPRLDPIPLPGHDPLS